METGYFAKQTRGTKVHLVEKGKPICGSKIASDMEFHWCAGTAQIGYVDCQKCRKIWLDKEQAKLEVLKKQPIKHFEF